MVSRHRALLFAGGIAAALGATVVFVALTRIPPGVRAGSVGLGGMSPERAYQRLNEGAADFLEGEIPIIVEGAGTATVTPRLLGVQIDVARTLKPLERLSTAERLLAIVFGKRLPVVFSIDDAHLARNRHTLLASVEVLPQQASLTPLPRGRFAAHQSKPGLAIDLQALQQALGERARALSADPISVGRVVWEPDITEDELGFARAAWQALAALGPHTLRTEHASWTLAGDVYMSWLEFRPVTRPDGNIVLGLGMNAEKMAAYIEALRPEIDRLPMGPQIHLVEGSIEEAAPPEGGVELNAGRSMAALEQNILAGRGETELVVDDVPPSVTLATLRREGISVLLGRGESDFVGSPNNRIHNIKTGAARYRSVRIAPGAEFSFNTLLGPVAGRTGYLPELVIKNNKVIPEYGGGLCQVSTTIFRGAVHAGLPIRERQNHSFIVSYYGAPGFDATIYPGQRDLRFVNDTDGALLLQVTVRGTKIAAEIYGQPTGREVSVRGPVTYESTPEGYTRTVIVRAITREGRTNEERFYSYYKPRALYTVERNPYE